MNTQRHALPLIAASAVAVASLLLTGCGIITFPLSLGAAVASNASFSFKGKVVDASGQAVDGVIVKLANSHHVWTPLAGSKDIPDVIMRRADGNYGFDTRGSYTEFTFSKDGYQEAYFRLTAERPDDVYTRAGIWHKGEDFPVVLLSSRAPQAPLVRFNSSISYGDYPVADAIALPNLATNAAAGDVLYAGKDAEDPTVFPAGTLYATLDKEPPTALNAKGDIDLADLDIPSHVTLHLPGPQSGFITLAPRVGFHPIDTTDLAPAGGYVHELTFTRERLKEMRAGNQENIIEAHEYFLFRAGHYYGKGVFSWGMQAGKPAFRYELYIQPEPDNRDLHCYRSTR